jgi:hypothetical protein
MPSTVGHFILECLITTANIMSGEITVIQEHKL